VSRTSIFQMKSNLQTIKKGSDSVSQYLHRIKEARDYLSAAGVYFADEDIVILALNGLPAEYCRTSKNHPCGIGSRFYGCSFCFDWFVGSRHLVFN